MDTVPPNEKNPYTSLKNMARTEKNRRAYILFAAAEVLYKVGDSDAAETLGHLAESALRDTKMFKRLGEIILAEIVERDMSTWDDWIGPPYNYGE